MDQQTRPPLPPFDEETAMQKVKAAQDAWNTRDPEKVSLSRNFARMGFSEVGSARNPFRARNGPSATARLFL